MIENINLDKSQVSAELHGYMYDAIHGKSGVFDYGNKLAYELVSNNEIKLKDGLILNYGRFMRVVGTESLTIANGISGSTRYDLIVAHFETDGINEIHDIRVLKGETDGQLPELTQEDIYNGGSIYELPLYSVYINGLNVETITPLFDVIINNKSIIERLKINYLNPKLESQTVNGIQVTNNGDGTFKLNGTATQDSLFNLSNNLKFSGKLKLLGTPKDCKANLQYTNGSTKTYDDVGDGVIIEHFDENQYPYARFTIAIPSGATLNNVIFKPMVTNDLNAKYDDFISFNDSLVTGASMDTKANKSDVLTYEEIQASTDLTGKIASASSIKKVRDKIYFRYIEFSISNDYSGIYQLNLTDYLHSGEYALISITVLNNAQNAEHVGEFLGYVMKARIINTIVCEGHGQIGMTTSDNVFLNINKQLTWSSLTVRVTIIGGYIYD